jgi:hypothetical protein
VLWGDRELPVTERELAILAVLSEESGRARTFAELAGPGGDKWLDKERVRSAIRRLRRKLKVAGAEARIESARGYGFRLVYGPNDGPPSVIVSVLRVITGVFNLRFAPSRHRSALSREFAATTRRSAAPGTPR